MDLAPLHKRVIGLDVHQAQITACAILEEADISAIMKGTTPTFSALRA